MNKLLYNIITFFLLLALIILFYVLYKNKERFIGTREWNRTRNMSYDIRGEPIIPYYPVGVFNQPEVPYKYSFSYYPEDYLGYTYDYINPYQGMMSPGFDVHYSVPYETNNVNK